MLLYIVKTVRKESGKKYLFWKNSVLSQQMCHDEGERGHGHAECLSPSGQGGWPGIGSLSLSVLRTAVWGGDGGDGILVPYWGLIK